MRNSRQKKNDGTLEAVIYEKQIKGQGKNEKDKGWDFRHGPGAYRDLHWNRRRQYGGTEGGYFDRMFDRFLSGFIEIDKDYLHITRHDPEEILPPLSENKLKNQRNHSADKNNHPVPDHWDDWNEK